MKLLKYDIRLLLGTLISCGGAFIGASDPATLYNSLEKDIKEKYDAAVKRGDFSDTLLLISIMADDAKQKKQPFADSNLCKVGSICAGNLGIARVDMPQLSGKPVPGTQADKLPKDKNGEVDAKEQFADYLKTLKYKITANDKFLVKKLKSTQDELVGSKVAGISFAIEDPNNPAYKEVVQSYIFISKDDYVIDGHHRWAAILGKATREGKLATATIRVHQIDAPIKTIIPIANKWAADFGLPSKSGDTSKPAALAAPAPVSAAAPAK